MSNSLANQLIVIALVTQIRKDFVTADIPNCAFQDTVSLVNIRPDSDGSYNFQSLRIPHNLTAVYRYEELSDGTRVSAPPHIRGCACKLKQCIQLCCLNNEMLDSTSKKCVNMNAAAYPRINTYMDNFTENSMIDVFQDFVPQQRMPCEEFKILNSELDSDFNILFENGTIYHAMKEEYIPHRDFCLTPFWYNNSLSLNPIECFQKIQPTTYMNMALFTASVPFLLATIWVYLYVPQLRCLHNSCLVCFLGTFALGSLILSSVLWVNYSWGACQTMGILCYFFMISAFFWLNVTCFDLWMSIRGIRYELQPSSPRLRFVYYSIYVWSAATIFTVIAITIEHTNISDAWKPGFGNGQCFIKSRDWSALLYFQGPSGLLNLFNVFFFIMSVINVYQIQEDSYELKKEASHQYKVSTFLRLFLVMGVSWILEIFTYLFAKNNSFIIVIFNMMNASQGIILFIVLVLKRRVLILLKNRWTKST
ncbi:G-protein coupled receptor Mth2-like isoform X1 [Zeugodacus cucurbitae]|uniref:G-protein coupled receptor Mth2-like isoform X1 n=1 Tax=Zeugodacus cucurbitae TaxID=28588 RepID=UPI0023D91B0D|nr:G-protein coupled receptor Mth2-like isoform X1 [Zeugodacus cucurbitae]